jgi:hypothetical protein
MTTRIARLLSVVALTAVVLALPARAKAADFSLDCTTGCNFVSFAGAFWSTVSLQPTGTGVFDPFLRVHATGQETTEDGHNTDGPFSNDEIGSIPEPHTHAVLLSSLQPVLISGQSYFQFALDLGEPDADNKSDISLDQFKICTGNSGTLTQANNCPTASVFSIDTGVGQDREVLLDYDLFGGGNGNSDLFVFVPTSVLAGGAPWFYLYTEFGSKGGSFTADGTFEEWSVLTGSNPPTQVPEPATLLLLMPAVALVSRRMFKN